MSHGFDGFLQALESSADSLGQAFSATNKEGERLKDRERAEEDRQQRIRLNKLLEKTRKQDLEFGQQNQTTKLQDRAFNLSEIALKKFKTEESRSILLEAGNDLIGGESKNTPEFQAFLADPTPEGLVNLTPAIAGAEESRLKREALPEIVGKLKNVPGLKEDPIFQSVLLTQNVGAIIAAAAAQIKNTKDLNKKKTLVNNLLKAGSDKRFQGRVLVSAGETAQGIKLINEAALESGGKVLSENDIERIKILQKTVDQGTKALSDGVGSNEELEAIKTERSNAQRRINATMGDGTPDIAQPKKVDTLSRLNQASQGTLTRPQPAPAPGGGLPQANPAIPPQGAVDQQNRVLDVLPLQPAKQPTRQPTEQPTQPPPPTKAERISALRNVRNAEQTRSKEAATKKLSSAARLLGGNVKDGAIVNGSSSFAKVKGPAREALLKELEDLGLEFRKTNGKLKANTSDQEVDQFIDVLNELKTSKLVGGGFQSGAIRTKLEPTASDLTKIEALMASTANMPKALALLLNDKLDAFSIPKSRRTPEFNQLIDSILNVR